MSFTKNVSILLTLASVSLSSAAETVALNPPNLSRGDCVMKAFANRKSARTFSEKELPLSDLSDLLWATNGENRTGKRTAPSAMNRQDIKVYLCTKSGAWLYDHKNHSLISVSDMDLRQSSAPACLVLVSDFDDAWSELDAGIVSQNALIFCAGTGLAAYPHTTMDKALLKRELKLNRDPLICVSVGYGKQ